LEEGRKMQVKSFLNLKKRKWFYGLIAVVAVICVGVGSFFGKDQGKSTAANIPLVRTKIVGSADKAPVYTYAGEVRGRYESQLAFQVGGKVSKRFVDLGMAVQAGDILMRIDPKDVKEIINNNAAQLSAAQAQQKLAESNLARYKQLYVQDAISKSELDYYQNAYDVASAAIRQATAQYEQGTNQLSYTRLVADQAGVVSYIGAETGQVVSAGEMVMTIVYDGEREIEIHVPENRLRGLKEDPTCEVLFWALPEVRVEGRVREIAPMANAFTRTYKVRISLVNPPPEVNLGMTASVKMKHGDHSIVNTIPLTALYQTENQPCVWVVKDNMVTLRVVEVGLQDNDLVQILSGLQAGEVIVTAGIHKLQPKQQIKVIGAN
jgi:RND family efflux transporter MFP subunit